MDYAKEELNNFDFSQIHFESDLMQVISLTRRKSDFEFPLKHGPINFSVLMNDHFSSNRWGVNTNKKGDAYVYCRDVPNAEKVSLHTSGKQHISIKSEPAKRTRGNNRFMNEWTEPDFEKEAIATFSLIFPPWGVGMPLAPKKWTKDELLIVGHKEKLVVVSFFIVDSAKKMHSRLPHFKLGELRLRPEKTLHIIAWKEPQNNLMDTIRSVFPKVSPTFSELELSEGDFTLHFQGYRRPNSAYMVAVPVHYTPPAESS